MTEDVHESAARLYQVAKTLGTEGKSALARLLNESPQVVNNWERRGVSEGGALKAQAILGCNAVYLLTGKGEPMMAGLRPEVQEIAAAFSQLSENQIAWAMKTIRVTLEVAPSVPEEADPPETEEVQEYSSPIRRAM